MTKRAGAAPLVQRKPLVYALQHCTEVLIAIQRNHKLSSYSLSRRLPSIFI